MPDADMPLVALPKKLFMGGDCGQARGTPPAKTPTSCDGDFLEAVPYSGSGSLSKYPANEGMGIEYDASSALSARNPLCSAS